MVQKTKYTLEIPQMQDSDKLVEFFFVVMSVQSPEVQAVENVCELPWLLTGDQIVYILV